MAKTKEEIENIVMAEDTSAPAATGSTSGDSGTASAPAATGSTSGDSGTASAPAATGSTSGDSGTASAPAPAEQTYAVKLRCPIYDKAGSPPHKPGEVLNVAAETARLWVSLNLVALQPGVILPDAPNADDVDDYPSLPVSRASEVIAI